MSTTTYFERGGQRFELPPAGELRTELRCDGCGKYLASDEAVRVDIVLYKASNHAQLSMMDAHVAHIGAAAAKAKAPESWEQ